MPLKPRFEAKEIELEPLCSYFTQGKVLDSQIVKAWISGYKQTVIADYLNFSTATISRRVKKYLKKEELFLIIKKKGLLWSYNKKIKYSENLDNLLIENTLKYAELNNVKQLFLLYGKRQVKKIWVDRLVKDAGFIKLNYFLARNFFKMNIEADFFKRGVSEREHKLRMLAS